MQRLTVNSSGVLYFTTLATPASSSVLDNALASVLSAVAKDNGGDPPQCVYQLRYDQSCHRRNPGSEDEDNVFTFSSLPLDLAFNDTALDSVKDAWKKAMGPFGANEAEPKYMDFENREDLEDLGNDENDQE